MAYPLPEILLFVLCGMLAGGQNIVEITQWCGRNLEFLRRLLPFRRGVPSHDTRNDVINALDARSFAECFTT